MLCLVIFLIRSSARLENSPTLLGPNRATKIDDATITIFDGVEGVFLVSIDPTKAVNMVVSGGSKPTASLAT